MRGLFITHEVNLYGAPTSLSLLLRQSQGIDVDILTQKWMIPHFGLRYIKKRFGNNAQGIYGFNLPIDNFFMNKKPNRQTLRNYIGTIIRKNKIYSFIKKKEYDFIHLNTSILYPLVHEKFPFIIHVREIYKENHIRKVSRALTKAKGVIFISEYARKPFRNVPLRNSIVLHNPFDMTNIADMKFDRYGQKFAGICNEDVVFSAIGAVISEKGIDFIIESFMKVKNMNIKLLVVGSGDDQYLKKCRSLAAADTRIIFYGEEENINKIYSISDYIMRGEAYPCIGRTTYEGLYGGCGVIVPGNIDESKNFFDYDRYNQKIYFYTPRDSESLVNVINMVASCKITDRSFVSNMDDCVPKFYDFIRYSIGHETTKKSRNV